MSTFDKALLSPPAQYSAAWAPRNEGANKLAFYVYLCVGVSAQKGGGGGGGGGEGGGGGAASATAGVG